jgi:cyclophilin family peptidyl-prolyl cis-trans isomerase
VPKPKRRREQQHLNQRSTRRRTYTIGGSNQGEAHKPGFPMSLLGNVKFFAGVGVVVAVIMVVSAILTTRGSNSSVPTITPTATATVDPNATPSPSTTAVAKTFEKAEQVVDAATKEYRATIKTSLGDFVIKLNADVAPNTVNSFVFLAQKGYFDNTPLHRVSLKFVIQMGDPTGTGSGSPGYQTKDEPNQLPNKRGTISMAKSRGVGAFGSQFFVNLQDNSALDFSNTGGDKFYPFAEVISGMEVVDAIGAVKTDANERPVEPITVVSVVVEAKDK